MRTIRMAATGPPLHDMLKNVSWLLGKWRADEGTGEYPTIKAFTFGEEVEFTHVGQPYLQFKYAGISSRIPNTDTATCGVDVKHRLVVYGVMENKCYGWKLADKKTRHIDLGFLRVKPGTNKVGLIIAMNLGVCELEEGEVTGQEMRTESHTLGRITFGKEQVVTKVRRVFRREGDTLYQQVEMETSKTPMTQLFSVKLKKID